VRLVIAARIVVAMRSKTPVLYQIKYDQQRMVSPRNCPPRYPAPWVLAFLGLCIWELSLFNSRSARTRRLRPHKVPSRWVMRASGFCYCQLHQLMLSFSRLGIRNTKPTAACEPHGISDRSRMLLLSAPSPLVLLRYISFKEGSKARTQGRSRAPAIITLTVAGTMHLCSQMLFSATAQ
jgi:hypothetical protein